MEAEGSFRDRNRTGRGIRRRDKEHFCLNDSSEGLRIGEHLLFPAGQQDPSS